MADNQKIKIIIKHEYMTRLKSKGFIIATILGPVIMIVFFGVIFLATYLSMTDAPDKKIAILDETGKFAKEIISKEKTKFFETSKQPDELNAEILQDKLDGYMIIPENVIEEGKVMLYTGGSGGLALQQLIENRVGDVIRLHRLKNAGATDEIISLADDGINIESRKVTKTGEQKDFVEAYAAIGYILGIMIYAMMFAYGGVVQRGVIEEKANRIIEVIASSAKPFEIMMGKVIGIGAVGLTQVLFWTILGSIAMLAAGPIIQSFMTPEMIGGNQALMGNQMNTLPANFELPQISPWLIIGFLFYFLAGYFLYATLFAAIGSAVDQESDAAQLQAPISILIIIPMLFISVIITNPDGVLSTVLSLIPFFTPTLMIIRVAASDVPLWQIILSVFLMIISFFASIWIAAKIYRVGIMMYGKKPSLKELIKWVGAK